MCGIVGCVAHVDVVDRLLSGLEHLEYRGYDSAGVAVGPGELTVCKQSGRVDDLRTAIEAAKPTGTVGIGHTRWSTHGEPTSANAHPHVDCEGRIAVVHNGVIDNHQALRTRLNGEGHRFASETDTEVVPHLLEKHLARTGDVEAALRATVDALEGSYALAVTVEGEGAIYAARNDSPLAIGVAEDALYVASDVPAFLEYTDRVTYPEDGDIAVVRADGYRIVDADGRERERRVRTVEWMPEETEKQGHDHFMKKEIFEQPESVGRTLDGRVDVDDGIALEDVPPSVLADVTEVQFVACGTSYHASLYGKELLVRRGIPASVTFASEYADSPLPADDGTLVVGVTQSGETADTLSALRAARSRGARTLALTNVVGSTAARECDEVAYIRAGPEIGVAATKTFSSQVAMLLLLAEVMADTDPEAPGAVERRRALTALPGNLQRALETSRASTLAHEYSDSDAYFFIGRGIGYPVALEGALKLKEISYEHAEGFPAGELKHGPLALVTADTPVIAVLSGEHDERTITNLEEASARGAPVIVVSHRTDIPQADEVLSIPETHPELSPVLANVQLQLVSYHLADILGRSIDKPRNLAKSVTVE